jgi:hypothetical protein
LDVLKDEINNLLLIVEQQVEGAIKLEDNDYHILLLKRSLTSLRSSRLLVSNQQIVDVPVLLRVVFEHVSRLYLVNKHKDKLFEQHRSAFQFMGKGPGPNQIYADFGDEFRMMYECLCSFSHPDLMGLLLNHRDENNESTKVLIRLPLLSIAAILSTVYPSLKGDYSEGLVEQTKQTLISSISNAQMILQSSIWKEQFQTFINHPLGKAPFRREELNEEVLQFIQMALENEQDANEFIEDKLIKILSELDTKGS